MKYNVRFGIMAIAILATVFWTRDTKSQQQGVATKAAEKIDEFGRAIKADVLTAEDAVRDSLNKTSERIRSEFAKTRASVHEMSLTGRIYGRLHWDKALHLCRFALTAEDGTVTVRGIVHDEDARAKAIRLVNDTCGVVRIIDQLGVESAGDSSDNLPKKP
jgi:osmotically-inducible protein OsmY